MTMSRGQIAKGDLIYVNASTTAAIAVGDIMVFSSGYVDEAVASAATTLGGCIAGISMTKKDAQTTATAKKITIQTQGLAAVTVTEEQAATIAGQVLVLSESTASLATIAATVSTTAVDKPYHAVLGPVIVPSASTGATTSTATTMAVVHLRLQ